MKSLKELTKQFFKDNPNGTLKQFEKYVKDYENSIIKEKFNEYKQKQIKFLTKGINHE